VNQFLSGANATLCAVAALFFWSFWRRTHERLFGALAGGLCMLAAHWACLGLANPSAEVRPYVYLFRFAAFVLIVWGVIDKNRSSQA